MSLPSDGVNMAALTSMNQAMGAGQDPAAQVRLCGVLPNLDFKPLFSAQEMAGLQFLNKNMLRVDQLKMFLTANQNGSALGPIGMLLVKLWEEISKSGGGLQDLAAGLTPDELRQLGDIREIFGDNRVEGMDAGHMRSMIGAMALQNVAMNQAALADDGHSIG